jgi:hypothetical protein
MASDLAENLPAGTLCLQRFASCRLLHAATSAQFWPALACACHACTVHAGADMHACFFLHMVLQAKELEACAAAKARLEEAFSRSMSELR